MIISKQGVEVVQAFILLFEVAHQRRYHVLVQSTVFDRIVSSALDSICSLWIMAECKRRSQ